MAADEAAQPLRGEAVELPLRGDLPDGAVDVDRGSSIMPSSSATQRSQPGATYDGCWASPFMYLPK